jgi:2-(1,2-epoxy-1,2-dihydrophenyl)acetyl-CoA isomerase
MAENESILLSDLTNGVLALTLNRPKVNAFNIALIQALRKALRQASSDPKVRCVLLAAHGAAFSAGQDLLEIQQAQGTSFRQHLLQTYNPLILQLRQLEKPVLAAINGPVSGAALGVVLACDLRIAADRARFVVGFLGIGLAPDSAVSLLLPMLIGLGRATEYAFSNAPISAEQALGWGMVNRVVSAAELDAQARAYAQALALGPLGAFGLAKRAFNRAVLPNLEDVLDYEAHLQDIAARLPEHQEGVAAFLEKRMPDFRPPAE